MLTAPGRREKWHRPQTDTFGPGAPFALYALPISYLVDPTGSVVGYFPGEADWTSAEAAALLAYFNTT